MESDLNLSRDSRQAAFRVIGIERPPKIRESVELPAREYKRRIARYSRRADKGQPLFQERV
ncbi:hypothetical protein EBZ39_03020 [bacterium]|nr:hypothetical protein [bacterium]